MTEEKYLFDSKLRDAIEDLIKEAKNTLVIISPYIDLSPTVKSALKVQLTRNDENFKLKVLFGKNGKKDLKAGKKPKLKDSLEFLMQFPNVEIRFEKLLHAKFYYNDYHMLFSSMNLYDYSEARNIEFGVLEQHGSKGLLGKAKDATDNAVSGAVNSVSKNVFGAEAPGSAISKFEKIFAESELLYQTSPVLEAKTGIMASLVGALGKELNKVVGKKVVLDNLTTIMGLKNKSENSGKPWIGFKPSFKSTSKLVSATILGKNEGLSYRAVVESLYDMGYIDENARQPTKLGLESGIEVRNTDNGSWLVYPESLSERL